MKFNLDDCPIGSNVVMHCSTEEEAVLFLRLLEEVEFYKSNHYRILEAEDFCFKSDTRHNEVPKELTDFLMGIMHT